MISMYCVPCALLLYPLLLWRLNGFYFSVFLYLLPLLHLMSVCVSLSHAHTHAHPSQTNIHTYRFLDFAVKLHSCQKAWQSQTECSCLSLPLGDQHYSSTQMFLLHLFAILDIQSTKIFAPLMHQDKLVIVFWKSNIDQSNFLTKFYFFF